MGSPIIIPINHPACHRLANPVRSVIFQLTLQAKKKAEEASKHAAGASKNTLDDLTYVGKSTLGDLTKSAKEAAAKKGLMKNQMDEPHSPPHRQPPPGSSLVSTQSNSAGGLVAGTGRDFFSSFSSEITNITSSTSTMFSGLFGKGEWRGQ